METDIAKLVDQVNEKYKQVNDNILQAYHKYKRYYDRKAQALPLNVKEFAFLLNPKVTTQSDKIAFNHFKWEGPFKVVKVLTSFNYIIRKVSTLRTQCVHRMDYALSLRTHPYRRLKKTQISFSLTLMRPRIKSSSMTTLYLN